MTDYANLQKRLNEFLECGADAQALSGKLLDEAADAIAALVAERDELASKVFDAEPAPEARCTHQCTTHIEIEDCGMIGQPSSKPGFHTVTMFPERGEPVKLRLGADAKAALRDILSDGVEVTEPTPNELASIATATLMPSGFGENMDGRDGERVGTNVATWSQWRDFFAAFKDHATKTGQKCVGYDAVDKSAKAVSEPTPAVTDEQRIERLEAALAACYDTYRTWRIAYPAPTAAEWARAKDRLEEALTPFDGDPAIAKGWIR